MTNNYPTFRHMHVSPLTQSTSITQIIGVLILILLAGCNSIQSTSAGNEGGYYLDDGPGSNPPTNLDTIPNATPKIEPLRKANMRPYIALGKAYQPMTTLGTYKERGIASWYGRRYHGKQTASGEPYNMYAMTAAHTTLPLPSYARVTNINNGKTIIVRINDRGPFLSNRLIDLSYTAAHKLGILSDGQGQVEVESIIPKQNTHLTTHTALTATTSLQSSTETHSNLSGIYLQLSAFSSVTNAHNFISRIQTQLPWLRNTLVIIKEDKLFKIQTGPYPNQLLAQQAADRIEQQLSIKPIRLIN